MTRLEEICKENELHFQVQVLGNRYCSLSMQKKKIHCSHLQEKQDQNGFCPCTFGEKEYQSYLKKEKIKVSFISVMERIKAYLFP